MLIPLLLFIAVLSTSLATIAQATFSTSSSSKIALQAHQYAEAEAALIRATNYNELTAHERTTIDNSLYESEIRISDETENADNIKQKTVSILIYRTNEDNPRYTLRVPRLEVETSAGVPIGTVIIWASSNDPEDGTWLECNGQSCSKYPQLVTVLGSNKVPDYRDRFLEGNLTPGIEKEAGLPDINASLRLSSQWQACTVDAEGNGTGAISAINKNTYVASQASGTWSGWTGFDFSASKSNPIYGASETVQPPSVTVRYLIKAA